MIFFSPLLLYPTTPLTWAMNLTTVCGPIEVINRDEVVRDHPSSKFSGHRAQRGCDNASRNKRRVCLDNFRFLCSCHYRNRVRLLLSEKNGSVIFRRVLLPERAGKISTLVESCLALRGRDGGRIGSGGDNLDSLSRSLSRPRYSRKSIAIART